MRKDSFLLLIFVEQFLSRIMKKFIWIVAINQDPIYSTLLRNINKYFARFLYTYISRSIITPPCMIRKYVQFQQLKSSYFYYNVIFSDITDVRVAKFYVSLLFPILALLIPSYKAE